jgi:hypothetical protein
MGYYRIGIPVTSPARPPARFPMLRRCSHLLALGATFLPLTACADSIAPPVDGDCLPGQWAADTDGYRAWHHDCHPFIGRHFTVYSDGSSMQAKRTLAGAAEELLGELADEFDIRSDGDLRFTPGYTYWVYALRYITPAVAEGYRNGFIWAAADRGDPPGAYVLDRVRYRRTVKHELMHVIQFTLTDCPKTSACPEWLDVWFSEAQAVFLSGTAPIPSLQEFRAWWAHPSHINPIRVRRWTDFPDPNLAGEYYPLFALTYAWLTDPIRGHGATSADCRVLFRSMALGDAFTVAFERTFGLAIAELEKNYFETMETFLGG